jgi:hypothetical protein
MPRDIRELRDDPEAYAAELRRRWGGLLSYRYIGRTWSQMDLGPTDNTVTLRSDMRSPSGAILLAVLGIAAPEGGGMSDLEAVPNPVIHSCQVLDPGARRPTFRGAVRSPQAGSTDGVQPLAHCRRGRAGPRARADAGSGHQHRHAPLGAREDAGRARSSLRTARTCRRCGRSSGRHVAPTVIGCCRCCRRRSPHPMPHCISVLSSSCSRPRRSTWRSRRRDRSGAGGLLARDVPGAREGGPVPRRCRTGRGVRRRGGSADDPPRRGRRRQSGDRGGSYQFRLAD